MARRFRIRVSGAAELARELTTIREVYPLRFAMALNHEAERIVTRIKETPDVPIKTGNLRDSGHVEFDLKKKSATVVFGGPVGSGGTNREDANYAVKQHEELDYHHEVGGPKYVEGPVNEELPRIAGNIRKECELRSMQDLERTRREVRK